MKSNQRDKANSHRGLTNLDSKFLEISPKIKELTELCVKNSSIEQELYSKYEVNRGLRDVNGNGVLTGLTEISEIQAFKMDDGQKIPCEGELMYRGIDIEKIVDGFISEKRFGFEEVTYLLIFGKLPKQEELNEFIRLLAEYRTLPVSFVRDTIMKSPTLDMMNTLARSVLTLHSYDPKANDISLPNVLRQCLELVAVFPVLSVYGYQTYLHYFMDESLVIHKPKSELSTAENILHMLRSDSSYTELEARILDVALVLHAEHGGGNNSTFTTRVVSSSGTDTYSAITAAIGSLKGPKHGGANIKVVEMFEDLKKNVSDWTDEKQIYEYLKDLIDKKGFDKSGLIYGMGHAVYSLSDPRANIFKKFVKDLSEEKGRTEEFKLYAMVEKIAAEVISNERKIYKGVSANIDFYSGFVYSMLNLPLELFTPIFAIARISGWSAHRMEELINASKIIRPAYKSVAARKDYTALKDR
ncbi:MAG: citrate/2-methylcitrate synthase [Peptostreptococcaceae bacterium]|nr:citrate/2-methylcitrate synthase [Peptostreptococcaceae bacterium]